NPPNTQEHRPGQVRLWAVHERRTLGVLAGYRSMVLSVAFAPDGGTLVSGGGDHEKFGEMILWDVARRARRGTLLAHRSWVECVAFSPSGRFLVSAGGAKGTGEIKVWQVAGQPRAPRHLPIPKWQPPATPPPPQWSRR